MVSIIHSGSEGSSIPMPMLAKVMAPGEWGGTVGDGAAQPYLTSILDVFSTAFQYLQFFLSN